MKKILTVILYGQTDAPYAEALPDNTELIQADGKQPTADFLKSAVKSAKGRYVLFAAGDLKRANVEAFTLAAAKESADALLFGEGFCFRTSLVRGLSPKETVSAYGAEMFAALDAESVKKTGATPFTFRGADAAYGRENEDTLYIVLKKFGAVKSKLSKEVYAFVSELICKRLITFYMSAMLESRSDKRTAERLVDFDRALKENIVMYLSLTKKFPVADLNKLRKKKFKISYFTARKFSSELKKKTLTK